MIAKARIVHEQNIKGYKEICGLVKELIGTKSLNIAVVTIDPNKSSRLHWHERTEEIYYIIEGTGEIKLNEDIIKVCKGCAIFIPKNIYHMITNNGNETMKLLSIDSPPYDQKDVHEKI